MLREKIRWSHISAQLKLEKSDKEGNEKQRPNVTNR